MTGHIRRLVATALLALVLVGSLIAWMVWPEGGAKSQVTFDPATAEPVLNQLAPETTLHMVEVVYRRYGAEAADVPQDEGPETQRSESWLTFDDQGVAVALRAETRGMDGTLVSTAALEGDDLVIRSASGAERHRTAGFRPRTTVAALKARLGDAITEMHNKVVNQPGAPRSNVAGREALVLEDRRPFTATAPPADAQGFQLPYVADLDTREQITRRYILPDTFRKIKTEVVIAGADGTETVVEYREWQAFEVIEAAAQ